MVQRDAAPLSSDATGTFVCRGVGVAEASRMVIRRPPVFILACGRSGSTLLQRLLNSHPAILIWGEHQGILLPLAGAWSEVQGSQWILEDRISGLELLLHKETRRNEWTAWDQSFSKESFDSALLEFMERVFCANVPAGVRWGFKEIRYNDMLVVRFLSHYFPAAHFVLLTRDPMAVAKSTLGAFFPQFRPAFEAGDAAVQRVCLDEVRQRLVQFTRFLPDAVDFLTSRATTLAYEDLVAQPQVTMKRLQAVLELDLAFDPVVVHEIMATRLQSARPQEAAYDKALESLLRTELAAVLPTGFAQPAGEPSSA